MNTCKTCKWWNHSHNYIDKIGSCEMVESIIKDESKTFEIEATADDDSNLNAILMTGENFGCIHHTPKN